MQPHEIDPGTFRDFNRTAVNTPAEQISFVITSLQPETDLAGRQLVGNYIRNSISDPDARHRSLIELAYQTQKGLTHMDLAPTGGEHAMHERLGQYEAVINSPQYVEPETVDAVQTERTKLTEHYQARIKKQWEQKAEDNPLRLQEFDAEITRLLRSRPPISEDNAMLAYKTVEELQQYFFTRKGPTPLGKLEQSNWPPGIRRAERNKITARLTNYAEKLIEKAPAEERAGLLLQQAEIIGGPTEEEIAKGLKPRYATNPSEGARMLRKAYAELSNVPADKMVEMSLKVAEGAVRIDTVAVEANEKQGISVADKAKNKRAMTAARNVEQEVLDHAIATVDALPRTVKEWYNDFTKSKKPWARNAYWTNAPSRRMQRDVPNPEFIKGRAAIAGFNASRVQAMIETVDTAEALADTATLYEPSEVHNYWAPVIRGLYNGIIETREFLRGNDTIKRGNKVSVKKLKKMRRYWPNFVAVVPPQVAQQADREIDSLLEHTEKVA